MSESTTDTTPVVRAFTLALYALEGHLVQNGALQAGQLARTLRLIETGSDPKHGETGSVLSQMADELDADHLGHGRRRLASVIDPTAADND